MVGMSSTSSLILSTVRLLALLAIAYCLSTISARAELRATVTPGHTFSAGDRPTTDTLNQLGQPSVEITGTIDGSVGLTAASVTGVHLANSVPDGVTIGYTNTTPRSLRVIPLSIGTNQISANIAGVGLAGGGGVPLRAQGDTNTITTSTNGITLNTNSIPGFGILLATNSLQLSLAHFTSTNNLAVPTNDVVWTNAHGLGVVPEIVRAVLVCSNANLSYAPGMELNLNNIVFANATQVANVSADSTNVYITIQGTTNGNWLARALTPANNSYAAITRTNWGIKIRARP